MSTTLLYHEQDFCRTVPPHVEAQWTTLGLAVVLFVSTNVDDIFILLALYSDPRLSPGRIVAGQCLGMATIVLVSAGLSALAVAVAVSYVGLLGLAPMGIGVYQLVRRYRGRGEDDNEPLVVSRTHAAAQMGSVMLITVANGGDNLGVYVPVFTTRSPLELLVLGASFILLTLVWCAIGYALVQHPKLGPPIRRCAEPAEPWVLIALGVFILVEAFS